MSSIDSRVSQALGKATGRANDPERPTRRGVSLFLKGLAQQHEIEPNK